ncbi:DUF6456 domain-containing protein [Acuticoccus sp. M5D2P5]|uniref:DUF6456 domain-containing protein n=1 Tax=Acuticoccus kalidii TaxID=2910977 RepID=UPI001F2B625B|nr:DUF6456 domain-containing protein [Acuticoccus kalidii]MCF3935599.1 DUF6456 domain-containing protein [Acuticoccus kalidii]
MSTSEAFVRALRIIGEREVDICTLAAAREGGVDEGAVAAMVGEGLLMRTGGRVRRSDAGRAYLRRALAGGGDAGFAGQHRVVEPRRVTADAEPVAVNALESPLAWLATRKDGTGEPMITPTQFEAGRRLHADYLRGHRQERVTQSWDPSGVAGEAPRDRLSASEAVLESRRRVEHALGHVGPGLADILLAVCCHEMGLQAVEKRHRWPTRSAKVVLRLALDRLAAHYGLAAFAKGRMRQGIVQWGTEDFRPTA